jgi:hypothetical protein
MKIDIIDSDSKTNKSHLRNACSFRRRNKVRNSSNKHKRQGRFHKNNS